jgi:hypothetical protein
MREYDRAEPLIYIHVPKTAGTSVREVFRNWFGPGLLEHYANEPAGSLPVRHDLTAVQAAGRPLAIYGHFNRGRGFGTDDYYPQVRQFVTVLRDPFERAISGYWHLVRHGRLGQQPPDPEAGLRTYLRQKRAAMIGFFPRCVSAENYREMIDRQFIEIGVMEHLGESLQRIAKALGRTFDIHELPRLNSNPEAAPEVGDLREEFIENNPLDFELYQYALERFEASRV